VHLRVEWAGDKKNNSNIKDKTVENKKDKSQHRKNSKLLDIILDKELKVIKRGKRIPFGGSCLIVAKKQHPHDTIQ